MDEWEENDNQVGNRKLWFSSKLLKIRLDGGRSSEDLGYMKKETKKDYRTGSPKMLLPPDNRKQSRDHDTHILKRPALRLTAMLGVRAHTFDPSTRDLMEELCECEASLVYRVSPLSRNFASTVDCSIKLQVNALPRTLPLPDTQSSPIAPLLDPVLTR
ncbi:hypothetical protein STEG23_012420, partial [Scotinomys teguina]